MLHGYVAPTVSFTNTKLPRRATDTRHPHWPAPTAHPYAIGAAKTFLSHDPSLTNFPHCFNTAFTSPHATSKSST